MPQSGENERTALDHKETEVSRLFVPIFVPISRFPDG